MPPRETLHEPRPVCPECDNIVDPKKAVVLHTLRGDEPWISAPEILKGVYCCSDHLLNAYLRGWPALGIRVPKAPIIRKRRQP